MSRKLKITFLLCVQPQLQRSFTIVYKLVHLIVFQKDVLLFFLLNLNNEAYLMKQSSLLSLPAKVNKALR